MGKDCIFREGMCIFSIEDIAMSKHPVSYDALIGFAAGDLDDTASAAVAFHATECRACSVTLARYRLVSGVLFNDDSEQPPPATLARARALYSRYYAPPAHVRWRPHWNITPGFAFAALALLLVMFGTLWMVQEAPPDTPFYPVRMIVEGLEIRASKAIKQFVDLATPTATATPTAENTEAVGTERATAVPANQPDTAPGQATPSPFRSNAPAAEHTKTPPGQVKTPPGQVNPPSNQPQIPPGQAKTPADGANTPAGRVNTPPGQVQTPPGQAKTPPAQSPATAVPGTPTATPTSKAQGPSK